MAQAGDTQLLLRGAHRETHEQAVSTMGMLSAVRRSAEDDGKLVVTPVKGAAIHAGTVATNEVIRRYGLGRHEDSFRYRRVSIHPMDSHDKADQFESDLIRRFATSATLSQIEEETQLNSVSYRALAIPITVSQDRCLQCHGSTKTAPKWLLKRYGNSSGFGWKRGQVVGMDIVYTPSEFPRSQALALFWSVTRSVGLLALICCGMLFVRSYMLVARPVNRMLASSEAIQRGEWPRWSEIWFPDELANLASSFHTTSLYLRNRVVREEKLRSLFQQFIPSSLAATALGKNADEVLTGTRHSVTVMIVNIRNFKLLMDHLPPDQTVATLNEYFAAVNKVIVANKGLVSKYMGDSVMALFGMPLGKDNHALNAVRAALSIPPALQDLYVRLDETYGWELGVGVGISTGEMIIGSFGSSEHLEYTVLGEVVTEAGCLEAATKSVPEEDSILISEATYRCVMSDVHVYDLGEKPGGSDSTLHAYVVQGLRSEVRSTMAA